MCAVLVDLQGKVNGVDTRWTFFQEPFVVEDPFGSKFPVPSEFDFSLLNTILRHKLSQREFSESRCYGIFKTRNPDESVDERSMLWPGIEITAAFLGRSSSNHKFRLLTAFGEALSSIWSWYDP